MKKFTYIITLLCTSSFSVINAQITANWHPTGPIAFPINVSGQINGIGRVTQIKFHPVDSNIIYATSASGGLWISNNAGVSWTGTGTDLMPWTQCASVCIDFTNDSIIYLGTGDPNYYGQGLGIWKSTDRGATFNPSNSNIGNRMALELLMDPADHNILIAATDDGIWKSNDAGATWQEKFSGGDFNDLKYKPSPTADTLYAVTHSQVYRSVDRGENWTQITNGVVVPNGNGEGMRLAVSPAEPEVVYVGMISDEGTILKSSDGGTSFSTVYHNPAQSLVGYDAASSGQGNYNFGMTADPLNADRVFVVAHCVWRSYDGGVTWTKLTDWPYDCHTDMHQIIYNPYNHNDLLNANDGGIFVSHDDGDNWDPFSDGVEATECYHAAQSPIATNMVSIGTQDNGELFYDGAWKTNRGGDWGERMAYDYQQFNRVYYFNGDRRTVTGGDQSWDNPLSNLTALLFTPLQPNAAFAGGNGLYRTFDLGSNPPSWTQIATFGQTVKAMALSPVNTNDLYVVLTANQIMHSTNAFAASPVFTNSNTPSSTASSAGIAVVKNNPNVVYLTCGSKVYRSTNQGALWINITYNLPPVNILKIYHDDYSTNESVYVASARGVYYKNDTMNYWANYSQNLPGIADIQDFMMINDGSPHSKLRVAYYGRGVWESDPFQPNQIPGADFTGFPTVMCAGTSVLFSDASTVNTTNWTWIFSGGTPDTATTPTVSVVYNTPGIYPVTLIATNANGSDSLTKTNYITVQALNPLPLAEGFAGNFLPPYWNFGDAGNDGVNWTQASNVGGFGASTTCAMFDNYSIDAHGNYDEIRTPHYDLSAHTNVMLNFDVAYAPYGTPYSDSLAVLVSTDCNLSFTQVYLKDPVALATAPQLTSNTFVPLPSQWRTESVDLSSFSGQSNVSLAFQNRGYYGQALYIDNINLLSPVGLINSEPESENVFVYPNPSNGIFTLQMNVSAFNSYSYEIINNLGQTVLQNTFSAGRGNNAWSIDLLKSGNGIYLLVMKSKDGHVIKKIKIVVI